jgi:DNA-directed RNA polymerase beta' subunit
LKLEYINFKEIFDSRKVITNHEGVDPKTKKFNPDGIFSEEIFGRLDNEGMQYSCECGDYVGKFYLGKICENCGTEVKFIEPSVERIGWIDLGEDFRIINPVFYNFILKLFSKKVITNIINYKSKLDQEGNLVENPEPPTPYAGIGIYEFEQRFDEILEEMYKVSKSKDKNEYYNEIKNNRELVFIDKIPVFSPTLRPAMMMGESMIFDEINNLYNIIILNSNMIKNALEGERNEMSIFPLLTTIQNTMNEVFAKIVESLKGKYGFIRNNIMGSRLNWTARNVITPLPPGKAIDEVSMPYLTFIELYKFQILNILVSAKRMSYFDANQLWAHATTHFNQEAYKIMLEIMNKTKGGLEILLNRNPSINHGSILQLRVTEIKKDYNDLTLSINNTILGPLAGDYDGDTLNIVALIDNDLKAAFRCFNPRLMLVDSNDGRFNGQLNIDRDQVLGMFCFNN